MIGGLKTTLCAFAFAAVAAPAAIVYAGTDDTEQSAFREAVKFGFSGEAIQGGVMIGDAPAGTRNLSFDGETVPFDEDGKFIIAFNRDAGQAAQLVATLDDGQTVKKFINIAPRKWKIEHVSLNRNGRTASEAFKRRRAPELAQINAARSVKSDSAGWREDFIWPVKGRISGMFGNQRIYNGSPGSYHSGIDIAAPTGTYYVAPADGVVTLAASSPFSLEGNLLMIDHGMGLNSAFLHSSEILVKEGQQVKRGEPIGRIGSTGSATGPHLHWSMKWNAARIDPILLTGPME
ncbi:M23 family metallopeptidase [uncultured Parasphingorhabdus sp.]|uniref:M23 family metallopeptidase n=1 Tax=uncultured Parasphingorhabdus sp. TaxID=2709694 RepID=UPI0030D76696